MLLALGPSGYVASYAKIAVDVYASSCLYVMILTAEPNNVATVPPVTTHHSGSNTSVTERQFTCYESEVAPASV